MARTKRDDKLESQNAAKTLLANIRFMSVDDPIRSIVITSSVSNEGKSTITVALAKAIATSGMRVLLVECDMRSRTLAGLLGVRSQAGIYSVLAEETPLMQAFVPTSVENMYLLDAEPHIPNPADVLASKRFAQLVDKLDSMFDYVIYDTPPVGTFVDGAIVSTICDATALVVRENFVKRQGVKQAYDQLEKAGANIVGVVMNFCAATSSEYYYAYYNQQGKRDHTTDASAPTPVADPRVFAPEATRAVGGKHGSGPSRAAKANAGRSASGRRN